MEAFLATLSTDDGAVWIGWIEDGGQIVEHRSGPEWKPILSWLRTRGTQVKSVWPKDIPPDLIAAHRTG